MRGNSIALQFAFYVFFAAIASTPLSLRAAERLWYTFR